MRDLNYQLKGLCKRCREGSFATQAARWRCLDLAATQLHDLDFRHLSANGLKPKHVVALIDHWKKEGVSSGTIKNRLAHLRWWAIKIDKPNIIPDSNSELGIENRRYVSNTSKAITLNEQQLSLISDPFVRCSLQLQQVFGLRREESIKFIPSFADHHGDSIHLKGSWCKGGQSRVVPITNDNQRLILDLAHSLAGKGSLIPSHRSYIQHLKVYESQTSRAGLHNLHGLRHYYAQERFFELTGSLSTAALNSLDLVDSDTPDNLVDSDTNSLDSNDLLNDLVDDNSFNADDSIIDSNTDAPSKVDSNLSVQQKELNGSNQQKKPKLSDQQKKLHKLARLTISKELGHHRLQVTSVYLGKPLT